VNIFAFHVEQICFVAAPSSATLAVINTEVLMLIKEHPLTQISKNAFACVLNRCGQDVEAIK